VSIMILAVVPLAGLAIVLLLTFVGCGLDSGVSVKYGQTCGVAKSTAVPCSAALRQSARPSSIVAAPSSPDGTTCV